MSFIYSWPVRLSARAAQESVRFAEIPVPVLPSMNLAQVPLNGSSPFPARRIKYGRRNIYCNRGIIIHRNFIIF